MLKTGYLASLPTRLVEQYLFRQLFTTINSEDKKYHVDKL
ncbi:hypothetical protein DES37_108244 [Mangrovibacter plantisponsor]|uniref:Uncharacterized protein n=1 Tax=Mangrovibacter plantisponsor TaxID=451513 RepID=A0A317PXI8_9ENTR|nr:hypothetical protein DES37_108244 [Mangrovibacter plantisponsor]